MTDSQGTLVARMRLLALAGALLLALTACSGGSETSSDTAAGAGEAAVAPQATGEPAAEEPAPQVGGEAVDNDSGDLGDTGDGAVGAGDDVLPPAPPASPGDRIIKEGTVHLEVGGGEFDRAFSAVVAEARRLGGDVLASTTGTEGEATYGSLTVRVPVTAFEDLLVGVARIGEVRGRDIRAQDVSGEFVDLEARLRHLQAQERFYLGLLEEASTVSDAIAVQQQLEGIQGQIEQVRGRLTLLEERTTFSRLTVELSEPGAPGGTPRPFGEARDLLSWWEAGLEAFVTMVGVLMVAVLFALPLLAVAVPLLLVWRGVRRRRREEPRTAGEPPTDDRAPERVGV